MIRAIGSNSNNQPAFKSSERYERSLWQRFWHPEILSITPTRIENMRKSARIKYLGLFSLSLAGFVNIKKLAKFLLPENNNNFLGFAELGLGLAFALTAILALYHTRVANAARVKLL